MSTAENISRKRHLLGFIKMLPTQSDGQIFHQDPSIFESILENPLVFEQDKIMEDLLADCTPSEGDGVIETGDKQRAKRSPPAKRIQGSNDEGKKTVHREIERQRRQEMAGLYAALRSLLPLEYVKGKRAISDQMGQAVKYIKDLQKSIDELKTRRGMLKKSGVPGAAAEAEAEHVRLLKVNRQRHGVEILIESGLNEESFPLSKVLAYLLERGLTVVTCVSTRGQQCHLHKLQVELNGTTSIDLSELQDRLVNLIKLA